MNGRHLLMLTFGLSLSLTGCATLVGANENFTLTAEWQNYERIRVRSQNGKVEVNPVANAGFSITGTKYARGATSAEAEANVELIQVSAAPDPADPRTLVVAVVVPDELRYKSAGASVRVQVPTAVRADVQTSNGSIDARGLAGPSELKTSNGRVHVENCTGNLAIESSNGSVQVTGLGGALQVHTSNGAVTVAGLAGGGVIKTSNGRVEVRDAAADVEVESSNGSIRLALADAARGNVKLNTSNGSIWTELPAALGMNLDVRTSNGRVHPELGKSMLVARRQSKSQLEGTLNGGGANQLSAVTSNGSITLTSR